MQQARINEIKTLKEPDQIKVSSKLNLKLPEVNPTPEVKQEAMNNQEVAVATNMDQGAKKEAVPKAGTDLNLKTDQEPQHVSDVERRTMNHKTVTSKKRHA